MSTAPNFSFRAVPIAEITAGALWLIPILHAVSPVPWTAHDFTRLGQLLVIALAALTWAHGPTPALPRSAVERFALLAFALCVAVSSLLSASPMAAIREVLLFAALLVVADASARSVFRQGSDWTLRVIAFGTLGYGVLVIAMAVVVLLSGQTIAGWELLTGFDNPRFLNHAQTVAVPLAAAVSLQRGASRGMRAVGVAATLASGALLYICEGRATVLGLLVGVVAAMLLLRGASARRYAVALIVPLVLGALAMGLLWQLAPQTVGGVGGDGYGKLHSRDYLLGIALHMTQGAPWFGVGPMHYAHVINTKAAHPHNVYAQWFAEIGIPATLLAAFLCVRVIGRWLRTLRSLPVERAPLAAALWTALIAMLVDGLFSGNFVMPVSQLWIALLIGLLMAVHRQHDSRADGARSGAAAPEDAPSVTAGRIGRAVNLVVVAAILVLVAVSFDEALHSVSPQLPGSPSTDAGRMAPRYWSYGWF